MFRWWHRLEDYQKALVLVILIVGVIWFFYRNSLR